MRNISAIVFLILPLLASSYYVKIGILSDDPDTMKTKKVWSMAQNYSTMMSLEPVVEITQWWSNLDTADVARTVCNLVKDGVNALVFLGPPRWNTLIASYSNLLGLPFISALENSGNIGKYQVSMLPDTSQAAVDFMTLFRWDKFTFIYDTENGADQLQKILSLLLSDEFVPRVEAFFRASDPDQAFRYINELLAPGINKRIVLATSEQFADQLVIKLSRGRNYNLLLLTPVGIVKRVSSQGFYTLTKLSIVNSTDPLLQVLENRWKTLPSYSSRRRNEGKDLPDSVILHYDSSNVLNTMVNKIAQETPTALKTRTDVDCLEFSGQVTETADYIKKVSIEHGATGKIRFDGDGQRTEYKMNIVQATPFDIHKIGTWSERLGLEILPEFSKDTSIPSYAAYRDEPPVRVTSIEVSPFLYRNEHGRLEGYVIDLLDNLFNEMKLNYELSLVKDGFYGMQVGRQWNGMIGELIRGEAQLAVAPLTKTSERAKVIDFSKSFMTFGLGILIKKQELDTSTAAFSPFSFLTIWSVETWIVVLLAITVYSAAGYGISRFIGAPDRVRALETKGTDSLSPCGSVWFTFGSLFCRDTGIYPRNLTHRLWSLLWWIFCIFISLLYVSMLASALVTARTTITTTHSKTTSQQILKRFLDNGYPTVGTLKSGSTFSFFAKSEVGIYQRYGRYVQENPQILTPSYKEGVEKVKKSGGDFAYIMESTSGQLVADTEPCDTLMTSGYLATRQYAVALPKNSPLKEMVDHAVLNLMETGMLRRLYEKWWHNLTTTCEDPELNILPRVYNSSLSLYEVSGIFYIFILLALIAAAIAVIEYYIKIRNITVE